MPKIAVNGTQVGYTRAGSGEPMILLRNSACSKVQWDAVRHCLQDRFEVLTADLPAMAKPAGLSGGRRASPRPSPRQSHTIWTPSCPPASWPPDAPPNGLLFRRCVKLVERLQQQRYFR